MFLLLFVVHNCRNKEINLTKSDFFINILLFVIKVTKMPFLIFNVFLLFVVHNCRNEAIDITKNYIFYKHFLICNPKPCINQAIKVNKSHKK